MADLAMFVIEKNGSQVEVRLVPIPDGPDDEDAERGCYGISFSLTALQEDGWKLIRAALSRKDDS